MDSSNKRKAELLGEPFGTASNRLRKMILFKCIQELGKDICYRCGEKIKNIEDLSIEHKTSWQLSEIPKETFYDLENITFSHLNCNIKAAQKPMSRNQPVGKSGLRGAYYHDEQKLDKPYQSRIRKNGKSIHLGYFKTAEEASDAYKEAVNKK